MSRMIRLTPLDWEERFCIRIAIGEKQKGHANRKGLGLAMGLFRGTQTISRVSILHVTSAVTGVLHGGRLGFWLEAGDAWRKGKILLL